MHDKTIRRRRAVLVALVVGCLLLLTASFGDSAGGGLGAVQRGASAVLTPVQDGASRALKPVRDGVGWVGDTFDAKAENKRLRRELTALRNQRTDAGALQADNKELRGLVDLNDRAQIQDMGLVAGRVIGKFPNVINQAIKLNVGTGDGVRAGQPVVTGDGLVGTVDTAGPGNAIVTLLTDADFGAGAKLADRDGIEGTVTPAPGEPRELRMEGLGADDIVPRGTSVVTSGTSDPRYPSPFPPDLPIGRVTRVRDAGSDTPVITVAPFVDVRDLDFVEVITKLDPRRS